MRKTAIVWLSLLAMLAFVLGGGHQFVSRQSQTKEKEAVQPPPFNDLLRNSRRFNIRDLGSHHLMKLSQIQPYQILYALEPYNKIETHRFRLV